MPKPLLMIKAGGLMKVATKKKKTVKKKVKPKKPVEPVRESPFQVGDSVWASTMVGDWQKATIGTLSKPGPHSKQWSYTLTRDRGGQMISAIETDLIPASVFALIATDAVRIKTAPWNQELNDQFGGKAMILAVYRQGQKRPWCYYIIPDPEMLWKVYAFKTKQYGYMEERKEKLCVRPANKVGVRLLPVSAVPQEILTYLGLHVYNRQWLKSETDGGADTNEV